MSRKGLIITALNLCVLLFCVLTGYACAEKSFVFYGKNYTLPEDSDFDYSHATAGSAFFYGAKSLGTLRFKGELFKSDKDYNHCPAFGAKGSLRLEYGYNGQFQKSKEENWHIDSDGLRKIRGYDLGFLSNISVVPSSTFFGWVMQYKGGILIEKPAEVKRDYEKMLTEILANQQSL